MDINPNNFKPSEANITHVKVWILPSWTPHRIHMSSSNCQNHQAVKQTISGFEAPVSSQNESGSSTLAEDWIWGGFVVEQVQPDSLSSVTTLRTECNLKVMQCLRNTAKDNKQSSIRSGISGAEGCKELEGFQQWFQQSQTLKFEKIDITF